jgi:tRNA U34 5-carboxymethylaminomethyl modifying GTPase MnmE/TrmE
MSALGTFSNTKYADPGEFSKRAFLNGQMDLGKKTIQITLKKRYKIYHLFYFS